MNWIHVNDDLPAPNIKVWVLYIPKSPIMEGTDYAIMRRIIHKPAVKITMDKNGFLTNGEVVYWMYMLKRPNK